MWSGEVLPLADPRGGARDARPPGGPNSFIFMQFLAKKLKNNSTFGSWRPPPGENPGSATDYGQISARNHHCKLTTKRHGDVKDAPETKWRLPQETHSPCVLTPATGRKLCRRVIERDVVSGLKLRTSVAHSMIHSKSSYHFNEYIGAILFRLLL